MPRFTTWYVDPINGKDTKTGQNPRQAFKSFEELAGTPRDGDSLKLLGRLPDETEDDIFFSATSRWFRTRRL